MSRMVWMGKQLHEMTPAELRLAERDINDCRGAVAMRLGEEEAKLWFDDELAELREEIAGRPAMPDAMPLCGPGPWLQGILAIERGAHG